ncbi:MAG TPA: electron transfer flavoprotein subunit alpha/FixB family protein [Saprospiraceae bacterium]|jgi:electron transfer flavoprotein alpha subunit|nr:electron transfer flavoprotein subunit alpha/FixB family protein [Saprospiraceae bacterium]HRO09758.1 electron transfer flavoprotein subunit alpha/FixB family protein [Saprospiraceae bacterium]HRP43003.1 electron transfer flavoprotein subunit alpha/FixB family protein [Saprospiraceae bacterium]
MSVIAYIESPGGHFKKSGFEVATYASKVASSLNTQAIAVVIGKSDDAGILGQYGISKVIHVNSGEDVTFDSQIYTSIIAETYKNNGGSILILSHTANGKSIAGRLAVRLNAGCISGVNTLPDTTQGFTVSKSVYSGKAIATYSISTADKILTVMGNSIQPEISGANITPESISISTGEHKVKVLEVKAEEGGVPLPEAELVVSVGRGIKGPENWGIIGDLANAIGAATACSRPVADADWRPHHEHVGQTGIAIRPNLYIAIGISGAIQHLAGVNNSKVIVVINKDPEAPFFKAADYGVVGDLFEIVPKLTEAVKRYKQQH